MRLAAMSPGSPCNAGISRCAGSPSGPVRPSASSPRWCHTSSIDGESPSSPPSTCRSRGSEPPASGLRQVRYSLGGPPMSLAAAARDRVGSRPRPRRCPATARPQAAAQRLAETYAPIAMLREQQDPPCDTDRGAVPADQRRHGARQPQRHPAATTSPDRRARGRQAGADRGRHRRPRRRLLPRPRRRPRSATPASTPRTSRSWCAEGKAPAVTYAHIAREPNHAGFALQYWFFWYFNQFNDLHEGDWEGMQLTFDAEHRRRRRWSEEPSEIILFQHAGGERAELGRLEGAEGGHAPGRLPGRRLARDLLRLRRLRRERPERLRRSAATTPPSRCANCACGRCCCPTRPRTAAGSSGSATTAAGASGRRATTTGRPGRRRRRSGANRSPGWRSSARPARGCRAARSSGPQVTGAFCGAVAGVSDLINLDAKSRPAAIAHPGGDR